MRSLGCILGVVAGVVLPSGASPLDPFDYETIQLRGDTVAQAGPGLRSHLKFYDDRSQVATVDQKCKTRPGDEGWPAEEVWNELNITTSGALLRPPPAASVCYKQTGYQNYNDTKCQALARVWSNEYVRMNHPIEVISLMNQGATCMVPSPGQNNTMGCTQGGYPTYVINASTAGHVQAGVNFARNNNLRLVIKNTGHDFSGKSLGNGALSIWTHGFKQIEFYANFTYEGGYTGPAFKVGSGVQASEILQAAHDKGFIVATGVCDSVGIYGGYSQGGGHTPLGAMHGMAADQILSLRVVTGDGQFRTASPTENPDLFWAIRGGGGSTFGVVTSMVIKAFPEAKTAVAKFEWGAKQSNISVDTFWKGISSYFGAFENFTDQGLFAQFNIFSAGGDFRNRDSVSNPRIEVAPFMGIGMTLPELKAATKWWFDEMADLGIAVKVKWSEYGSFFPEAYYEHLPPTNTRLMPLTVAYASRLIPRENLDRQRKLNETMAVYRALGQQGHMFNGFQLAPTLERGKPVGGGNAVLPAWRDALSHTIVFVQWPENATAAEQLAIRKEFATHPNKMQLLRDVTPNSGSYLSESDRLEPDWQKAFYGVNYPKLLEIKNKYDPADVFYAVTAVGSEKWSVKSVDGLPTENGPLCRV